MTFHILSYLWDIEGILHFLQVFQSQKLFCDMFWSVGGKSCHLWNLLVICHERQIWLSELNSESMFVVVIVPRFRESAGTLRPYVRRKSDFPLYIGQIHAFYFDTTPYTLNDNLNTKSVWLNNLIDVCLQYCIETTWTMFQTVL